VVIEVATASAHALRRWRLEITTTVCGVGLAGDSAGLAGR